jgi:glycolate oxidase iron-sulfur subunit
MDSPRGRIYQMQAVADGKLEISDDFVEHMYCCVGCRACETACPSGVQFGKLIEAAREQIQLENHGAAAQTRPEENANKEYTEANMSTPTKTPTSLAAILLRRFFFDAMLPSRTVLSLVFGGLKVYQRSGMQNLVRNTGLLATLNKLPTPFKNMLVIPEKLMESAQGDIIPHTLPEITPALGERRYRVGFVSGCIMDQVFHDINEASIRVLAANGCEVITPVQQSCCGALHVHGGEAESGRDLARHNIDVFAEYNCDAIIINSAGCGSTLKEYDHLLRDDSIYLQRAREFSAKVKDISEFLASIDCTAAMGEVKQTVAYHDACHLLHGQKIKQQPRQLLKSIPGIQMVDLKESDWCCGSAGIYNITNQEMGQELLQRKMNNIEVTGASIIATGNPGCMMQIAMGSRDRGLPIEVMHPVQLLDKSYQAGGAYTQSNKDTVTKRTPRPALWITAGLALLITIIILRKQNRS